MAASRWANPIPSGPKEGAADQACPALAGPLVYRAKHHAAVRTDEYLYNQLIPYIGNKRKLLRLIASGKTPTAIAKELALSVKTISTYRMRILEKMNMANNAELTHYAIQNQLV